MGFPMNNVLEILSRDEDNMTVLVENIKDPEVASKVEALVNLIQAKHESFSKEVSLAADTAGSKVTVKSFIVMQTT